MIFQKQGAEFCYENRKYTIGEKIVANGESEYEGLIGTITEIRTGTDKETENDTPDIYCHFAPPVLPGEIQKIEQRFSRLFGEKKTVRDLGLDLVIMAPEMLEPIENLPEEPIFLLIEDWADMGENGTHIEAYSSIEQARIQLRFKLGNEINNGSLGDWREDPGFTESSDADSYSGFIEGFYCEEHYEIRIDRVGLNYSPKFVRNIGTVHEKQRLSDDFREQVEDWDSFAALSEKKQYELTHSEAVAERIRRQIEGNADFLEAYWLSVSEASHEIVNRALKEEGK